MSCSRTQHLVLAGIELLTCHTRSWIRLFTTASQRSPWTRTHQYRWIRALEYWRVCEHRCEHSELEQNHSRAVNSRLRNIQYDRTGATDFLGEKGKNNNYKHLVSTRTIRPHTHGQSPSMQLCALCHLRWQLLSLTFNLNVKFIHVHRRQFACNVKTCFLGKIKKTFLKCLLKFLPRVLRFKATFNSVYKCEKASWLKNLASKK